MLTLLRSRPEWADKHEVTLWAGLILLVILIAQPLLFLTAVVAFSAGYFFRKEIVNGSAPVPPGTDYPYRETRP